MNRTIEGSDYNIHIGPISLLNANLNSFSNIVYLMDDNVFEHCWPILEKNNIVNNKTLKIIIPHGEDNKKIETCSDIFRSLISFGIDRKSIVINLGGGVVGDMGGYCASVFLRGIPFIQIPTTLLAMVDASVGGKVAINFNHYKNMIGLFQNPKAVFIDPWFLKTLTERHINSGYVEVLKHGLISSKEQWNKFKKADPKNIPVEIIHQAVSIKNDIVLKDFKESNLRKVLNLGHTAGHALESILLKEENPIYHGEAIAFGLAFMAYLSHELASLSETERNDIIECVLPFIPRNIMKLDEEQFIHGMKIDKKNHRGKVCMVLLDSIGSPVIDQVIAENKLKEALRWTIAHTPINQKN